MNQLRFRTETTRNGVGALTPEVDGASLTALVRSYEEQRGYSPAGEYDGIVPEHFNFGDLALYYLGIEANQWPKPGEAWLLGCECGEAGCWPLAARITIESSLVVWSNFKQPHRPQWDYASFGSFTFDRDQYEQAVADGIALVRRSALPQDGS